MIGSLYHGPRTGCTQRIRGTRMERCDLVVVGAGVVGLTAAAAFARRHPSARVAVIDKERRVGQHASGRNSGVLHAGFYYGQDSMKARFSVEGNRAMRQLCEAHDLPIRRCGKLVVARNEAEGAALGGLVARGRANGVRVERLTEADAHRIEPAARAPWGALWSPDTAVVDPGAVMAHLVDRARAAGIAIHLDRAFLGRAGEAVQTSGGPIDAGLLLNCAGAHADRVGRAWAVGGRFAFVPFRGSYVLGSASAPAPAVCIYPVPDPAMPFLGVHLTVTTSGGVKIGPTAAPARWREDYGGWRGIVWADFVEQVRIQARLAATDATFRAHALREAAKHSRTWLVREARTLMRGLRRRDFRAWGRPGVRAQLVDRATGRLVGDFVVEDAERSVHVLNAVSPAFTGSLPFAEYLADRLEAVA